MQRRTYHFTGRVQGVGFRYTAQRATNGKRVAGYVRNLDDGRVELVMEGLEEEMDAVLETIQGEMGDNIRETVCHPSPGTGEFRDFRIRH